MGSKDFDRNALSLEMGDRSLTQPGKVVSKFIAHELRIQVGLRILVFSWIFSFKHVVKRCFL